MEKIFVIFKKDILLHSPENGENGIVNNKNK